MITNRHIANAQGKLDKTMTNEQFEQIVDAIITGKYSWACVLILRFAGYNPLHYIPYRTYNRLLKDNCCSNKSPARKTDVKVTRSQSHNLSTKIDDLDYVELAERNEAKVRGGFRFKWIF